MQVRPSRYWIETVWNGFGLLQYLVSSMKRFETVSDYYLASSGKRVETVSDYLLISHSQKLIETI
jgi:hypothetical protein